MDSVAGIWALCMGSVIGMLKDPGGQHVLWMLIGTTVIHLSHFFCLDSSSVRRVIA